MVLTDALAVGFPSALNRRRSVDNLSDKLHGEIIAMIEKLRRGVLPLAAFLFSIMQLHSARAVDFDIDASCKRVAQFSGGSASLELSCRKMEASAKARIAGMQVPADILAQCERVARFGGASYSVLETCIGQEMEARARLNEGADGKASARGPAPLGDKLTAEIKQRCSRMQAVGGYSLVESCIEEESASVRRIGPRLNDLQAHDPEILKRCAAMIATGGYPLAESCIDQELAAKKRLGR